MKASDPTDSRTIRYRMRRARFRFIERLIDQSLATKAPGERVSILDIGGRSDYWSLLDDQYRDKVVVTLLNTEEDVSKEPEKIGLDIPINVVVGDGTDMPQYADGSFDLAHSNSVIEHVGLYRSMANLAAETRRVGRAYYLQTPNFWFPLEPHYGLPFIHWLPEPTRLWLHSSMNVGFAKKTDFDGALTRVDHTRIVSRRLLRHAFPDGTHETEKFAFLNKSLIVYRDYPEPA